MRQRAFGRHNVTTRPTPKRDTLWLAMRQMIRFDIPTLVMTTEANRRSAADFVYALAGAGYLRKQRIGNGAGVVGGCRFMWQLVRDTGPKTPITKRDGSVVDQNEQKTYPPLNAKGNADAEDAA